MLIATIAISNATQVTAQEVAPGADSRPNPVFWDGIHMHQTKLTIGTPDMTSEVDRALKRLQKAADQALAHEPYSVIHKSVDPPSGDRHDYMSYSRYWWPDPDQPDGKPYIRHDGRVNRKLLAKGDRNELGDFTDATIALCLASYFLDDERYGTKAAELIQVWFLNDETKMNPHLKYGQAVPGRSEGRGPGIIDTRAFMFVLDGVELLDERHGWTADNRTALENWFGEFADWLQTSDIGDHERKATNNHGAWYDAQVSRYALFAGNLDTTKSILESVKRQRIAKQFDAEGRQEAELKRTKSLHYSVFNLTALSVAARVGDRVGEDIWNFVPENGCGMQCGFDFVLPHLRNDSDWPYPTLGKYECSRLGHAALRFASRAYKDSKYQSSIDVKKIRHFEAEFTPLIAGKYSD